MTTSLVANNGFSSWFNFSVFSKNLARLKKMASRDFVWFLILCGTLEIHPACPVSCFLDSKGAPMSKKNCYTEKPSLKKSVLYEMFLEVLPLEARYWTRWSQDRKEKMENKYCNLIDYSTFPSKNSFANCILLPFFVKVSLNTLWILLITPLHTLKE